MACPRHTKNGRPANHSLDNCADTRAWMRHEQAMERNNGNHGNYGNNGNNGNHGNYGSNGNHGNYGNHGNQGNNNTHNGPGLGAGQAVSPITMSGQGRTRIREDPGISKTRRNSVAEDSTTSIPQIHLAGRGSYKQEPSMQWLRPSQGF